ncbi:MAG: hypothetical protein ACE5HV_00025 [Acidobacteriota bacterium]
MTEIDDLIVQLEAAERGSREFDEKITALLGVAKQVKLKGSDVLWKWADGTLHCNPPKYTTSLDAALPGENIVSTTKSEHGWAATNLDKHTQAQTFGNAHTEALARRIAALKARREMKERRSCMKSADEWALVALRHLGLTGKFSRRIAEQEIAAVIRKARNEALMEAGGVIALSCSHAEKIEAIRKLKDKP